MRVCAETLKPIEGYTITTLPYGGTWHICDTCGMAVAPDRISAHARFEDSPDDPRLEPMAGYTITSLPNTAAVVHLCDTCGRALSPGVQSLRFHLLHQHSHPAADEQLQLSDRLQKMVEEFGLDDVVTQVEKIRQATPRKPTAKAAKKATAKKATRLS
jgi:hypothetical protein